MWAVPRIDSLRRAMRMAYEDSEGRKKRRENARKTALKYDWDQSAIIATNALRLL
jgi:hypothetical protein